MLTQAQTKKLEAKDLCTCSTSQNVSPITNANDKKEITDMVNGLFNALRVDLERNPVPINWHCLPCRNQLKQNPNKSDKLGLKPDYFTGSTAEDANQWLDFYERLDCGIKTARFSSSLKSGSGTLVSRTNRGHQN